MQYKVVQSKKLPEWKYFNCEPVVFDLEKERGIWRDIMPIMIEYSETDNIEHLAGILYHEVFIGSVPPYNINICRQEPCKEIDLRLFLHMYFMKVSQDLLLKVTDYKQYNNPNEKYYYVARMNHSIDNQRYQVLGGMFALAQLSSAYIGLNFLNFVFEFDYNQQKNLDELEYIDEEQYLIFKEIWIARRIGSYRDDKEYSLEASPKPFCKSNNHRLRKTYSAFTFPLKDAAIRIFNEPYAAVRNQLLNGKYKYFPHYFGNVQVKQLPFPSINRKAFLFYWKHHSICKSSNCHVFWICLEKMSVNHLFVAYQNITGYQEFPEGGFSRFPKLEIVDEENENENKIVLERFIINLEYFDTVEKISDALRILKINQ